MGENTQNTENSPNSGILDAIIESEQAHALADFDPQTLASDILSNLKDRDKQIITLRFGLIDDKPKTLDAIGKELKLTRERVRQIEKDSLRQLKAERIISNVNKSIDIVKNTVHDHGGIFAQENLINHLLISNKTTRQINALLFLLELSEHFSELSENEHYHSSWYVATYDLNKLYAFHDALVSILKEHGQPVQMDNLKQKIQGHEIYKNDPDYYQDRVIENLISVSKKVKSNPFGEYGLQNWRVVRPRDVGDKAYLILVHEKKPMHYTKITELINQRNFDNRAAYKETVHNELIMDERFILVGRGIYALSEWGYKKGVVADIIKEILSLAGEPVERLKIIDDVLKQRVVKRNTILVGLTNKKLFKKIGKSKYALSD